MRLTKFLKQSPDILLALSTGVVALFLSLTSYFTIARWIFGFLFVFFGSGYPATRLLPKNSSIAERIIASSLVSLLLTYPASILTVAIEGQSSEAIFGYHLTHSLFTLFIFSLMLSFYVLKKQTQKINMGKFPKLVLLPLLVYAFLTFFNLGRADVLGDEYDLGYQAYNLVDGIVAGRKAFLISLNQHPPLAIDIKHFSMNILEPNGFDNLKDWQFRVSEGLVGLLTILAVYELGKKLYSKRAGIIASSILAVNNYMVWMGRIFHREMYLTFFMTTAILFYMKAKKEKKQVYVFLAGLAFGAALLVKETALIILVIPLVDLLFFPTYRTTAKKTKLLALLIFSPVILYNIIAFTRTGHADVFFSNLFGTPHPLTTPRKTMPIQNTFSLMSYLQDIYSPVVFVVFLLGIAVAAVKKNIHPTMSLWILTSILFFAVTSVRAYYFIFLTIPLVITVAGQIVMLPNKALYTLLTTLLVYSLFYSANTNIARGYSRAESIGEVDGSIIVSHPITQHYSLAARSWVEEVGYKRLQAFLDMKMSGRDCLIVSESMNPLAVRRYLGLKDAVKEHYLGQNYLSRYPRCPRDTRQIPGTVYLVNGEKSEVGELIMAITDHLGNERFYLYVLPKGDYA